MNFFPFTHWRLFGVLFVVLAAGLGSVSTTNDAFFDISKNLDVFGKVLKEVSLHYVDEIEVSTLTRKGFDAMLGSLDPYTNFISASEVEDYRFQSTGEYGGVGARVEVRKNKVVVVQPYPNEPAFKAGLRAGDVIIQIDNELVEGREFTTVDIRNMLRGEAGKSVVLKVRRPGKPEPLVLTVVREQIKVKNVPYYGLAAPDIGYIQLTGFTRDAHAEVKDALQKLKEKYPNLKGIVLDLRSNPGGLLMEAVAISNLFVPQNEVIVETRGRMEGTARSYRTENQPYDTRIPLAVLINEHSASASEIVSGVMQDLDRGVIIGQKSYGKGLVQTTRPLSYNNQIKITTSRYYTPSGRCIQAINYSERRADGSPVRVADSLRQQFKTRNGRPVLDGGGIAPDVDVDVDRLHQITQQLISQHLLFDFATEYTVRNATLAPVEQFQITDAVYDEFVAFVEQSGFRYESAALKDYERFRDDLRDEAYFSEVEPELEALRREIETHRARDIRLHRAEIIPFLQQEIVTRYYHEEGRMQVGFRTDDDLQQAVQVLNNSERYRSLLAPPR
jgi:carboxyl-terminal processing protease